MTTIAFDIYDTLIDTQGISVQLRERIGGLAPSFAQIWRDKQLEYSFRRGLMGDYVDFPTCTEHALTYTDQLLCTGLSKKSKQELLTLYRSLPAFDDVIPALQLLRSHDVQIYALTNGLKNSIESLFEHANIADFFQEIISVDEVHTFKPSPEVYNLLVERSGESAEQCWMVSANTFDIIGAHKFGLKTSWIKRKDRTVMDPWGYEPTLTLNNLTSINQLL